MRNSRRTLSKPTGQVIRRRSGASGTNVVPFLLHKGMEVCARPHRETGLHWAAYGGHSDIVKLLLKRKSPVDVKDDRFGATPLGWALHGWCYPPPESQHARYIQVVTLLVAAGAKVAPAKELGHA